MSKQRKNGNKNHKEKFIGYRYKIQCFGNGDLLVEGCKGILKYEQEEIRLNVGNGQILIMGKNLNIPALERDFAQIQGVISQIELI